MFAICFALGSILLMQGNDLELYSTFPKESIIGLDGKISPQADLELPEDAHTFSNLGVWMLVVTSVLFCCGHTILTCHVMSHCGAAIVFTAIAVITNSRMDDILSTLNMCTDNFRDDGSDLEKACHSLTVI